MRVVRAAWPVFVTTVAVACASVPVPPAPAPGGAPRFAVTGLAPGARVRYVHGADPERRMDRLMRATRDSLWLSSGRVVAVVQLRSLEVADDDAQLKRLLWSGTIGAAAGAVLGALLPPDTAALHRPHSRAETAALGGLVGTLAGVIGWVILTGDGWEPVPREP